MTDHNTKTREKDDRGQDQGRAYQTRVDLMQHTHSHCSPESLGQVPALSQGLGKSVCFNAVFFPPDKILIIVRSST